MKKAVIYTTPTCVYCQMAKDFMKEKGVEYEEKDVAVDPQAREEAVKKSGQMGVPVIVVGEGDDEKVMVGFDKGKLGEALGV